MQPNLAEVGSLDARNENQRAGAVAFGARGDGGAAFQLSNELADAHGGKNIAANAVERELRRNLRQFVGEILQPARVAVPDRPLMWTVEVFWSNRLSACAATTEAKAQIEPQTTEAMAR